MATRSAQSLVQDVLREGGPLPFDELMARVLRIQPIASRNPKLTIRNALGANPLCQSTGDGRYVYLPTFLRGACMRLPMGALNPKEGALAIGVEVRAFLWLAADHTRDLSPTLALDGGPEITLDRADRGFAPGLLVVTTLPKPFWQWWSAQHTNGADALLVRCEDGEAARYSVRAIRADTVDREAVAVHNALLRDAAAAVLKSTQGMRGDDLVERLLARGIYHGDPAPDPLAPVLYSTPGPFVQDRGSVTYRPDITPAMWRLFGPRLTEELGWDEAILREVLDMPSRTEPEEPEEPEDDALPDLPPATRGFRLKVSLAGMKRVWRIIEMLDNQTLEDLHLAIQDAFHWDNDHLYAFFLSGRRWDHVTEVASPLVVEDQDPPFTDEVMLAELDLHSRQSFLYLFDFGDQLEHLVEVVDTFPVPARGAFPRLAEWHGEAPPQYPNLYDEDDLTDLDDSGEYDGAEG